ncbi:hypothetical protein [Emticicia fluvialis]|uniref:hypothetical protein n=1 Tax=Emticicia fluvialis TaxID=2974474 RepID=UPI0021660550|nr:hypothetical protein [Emticicia fluvialis]
MKTILVCFIFLLGSAVVFGQPNDVPTDWKAGDVWTYELKKREATRWQERDEKSLIVFELKITGRKPGKAGSYEAEWRYLSINTLPDENKYDSCLNLVRKFLLHTPLQLSFSKEGGFEGWTDLPGLRNALLATQGLSNHQKRSDDCFYMQDFIRKSQGDSSDFLSGYVPEVKQFFKSLMLLKADSHLTRDTVTVMENELAGRMEIPKTINRAVRTSAAGYEVSLNTALSPAAFKQFKTAGFEKAWIEMGLPVESMATAKARLEAFQPQRKETMLAVFEKPNGVMKRFVYQYDEYVSPMEDDLLVYEFVRK